METYFIVQNPPQATPREIYTAQDGHGYIEGNELHLISTQVYYIYKRGENEGWYMRNKATNKDFYLGEGASPTINLADIVILDEEYWASITYTPQEEEE